MFAYLSVVKKTGNQPRIDINYDLPTPAHTSEKWSMFNPRTGYLLKDCVRDSRLGSLSKFCEVRKIGKKIQTPFECIGATETSNSNCNIR